MKKIKNKVLLLITLIVVISSGVAYALSHNNVQAQMSMPLTVAPARQQIKLDPGEQTAINLKFYNLGESPVSGVLKVADFVVDNNTGSPRIIDNPDQASPKFSASKWIKLPYDRVSIPASGKVIFQAKITVPKNAKAGGRYAAVYFEPSSSIASPVTGEKDAGLSVSSRVAALVYIRVNGDIYEKAIISRFFTPSFLEYGPVSIQSEILNRGNYHIRPRGVITLTNMFNGLTGQSVLKEKNIFPDVSRTYESKLGSKWMLGRYKIDIAVSYGDQGHIMERTAYVWLFPWRVASAIVLAIIVLLMLGNNIYKKLIYKEANLEDELKKEKEELEKLKKQLSKNN